MSWPNIGLDTGLVFKKDFAQALSALLLARQQRALLTGTKPMPTEILPSGVPGQGPIIPVQIEGAEITRRGALYEFGVSVQDIFSLFRWPMDDFYPLATVGGVTRDITADYFAKTSTLGRCFWYTDETFTKIANARMDGSGFANNIHLLANPMKATTWSARRHLMDHCVFPSATWIPTATYPADAYWYQSASASFNGSMWVFGGLHDMPEIHGGMPVSDVWRSFNGATWTKVTSNPGFPGVFGHCVVEFNGALWLFGGRTIIWGYYPNKYIFRSTDGIHWQGMGLAGFGSVYNHACTVHNGKIWITGGIAYNDSGDIFVTNAVWYSSDGTTWTQVDPESQLPGVNIFPARQNHSLISFNGRMWITGGDVYYYPETIFYDLWSSEDGVTWEWFREGDINTAHVAVPNDRFMSPRRGHLCVIYNGEMVIFGGSGYAPSHDQLMWCSPDGITWHYKHLGNNINRVEATALVFNNTLWLIGGNFVPSEDNPLPSYNRTPDVCYFQERRDLRPLLTDQQP